MAVSSTPISRRDEAGNTHQVRRLKDGSVHEVLKNFPSETMLREDLRGWGRHLRFRQFRYYWMAEYEIQDSPEQETEAAGR